jgi:hypothetical protein
MVIIYSKKKGEAMKDAHKGGTMLWEITDASKLSLNNSKPLSVNDSKSRYHKTTVRRTRND